MCVALSSVATMKEWDSLLEKPFHPSAFGMERKLEKSLLLPTLLIDKGVKIVRHASLVVLLMVVLMPRMTLIHSHVRTLYMSARICHSPRIIVLACDPRAGGYAPACQTLLTLSIRYRSTQY